MKKLIFWISVILGIALMSCNKDKDPIVVQPISTGIIFTDVYVLDSIVHTNASGYADTIRVTANRMITTAPSMYGKNNNTTVEGTYQTWGDYYSFTSDLQHDGNPYSGVTGFYSFRGDTLDYVYEVDNSTLNPIHKALYVKI
jgi:hypothetical protein